MMDEHLPPDLANVLVKHSPRLVIDRPTLVKYSDSPTGWILIEPKVKEGDPNV